DRPGLRAFYVGEGVKRAFLFQTLEVGVLVATVPQLGISVLPRSRFAEKHGTEYLYVFHSMASTHMIYEPDGFDHYDTVFCVGPYMIDEVRRREEIHGLPAKELVEHGYGRLDAILAERVAATPTKPSGDAARETVLVAPSWGPTCTFETVGVEFVAALLDAGFRVIARPHPMTDKKDPAAIERLVARFADHADFELDQDIAATRALHESDVMVSDWSGAALEYALGRERPVVFIDVERKVNNPEYAELGIEPFEVAVRDRIGAVVAADDPSGIVGAVRDAIDNADNWAERLRTVRDESIFNVGDSGRVAAAAIAAKTNAFLARVR
ncbi:MAG: CDP-glycerol glycerophosphotransferase family protein, partial [Acidimicrobiia bacterium]